jgi:hypothetical protein
VVDESEEEEEPAPPVPALASALDQRAARMAASMAALAPTPPAVLTEVTVQAEETKLESACKALTGFYQMNDLLGSTRSPDTSDGRCAPV